GIREAGQDVDLGDERWPEIKERMNRQQEVAERISAVEEDRMGSINYELERLRLARRGLELSGASADDPAYAEPARQDAELQTRYEALAAQLADLYRDIGRDTLLVRTVDGVERELPFAKLVRLYRPNAMNMGEKLVHYGAKVVEFVADEPREANTEG